MRLVECDKSEINTRQVFKKSKWMKVIDEFLESGMECCKVENYTNKDAKSCSAALNVAIKHYHKGGIRACLSDGVVYLIKIEK